MSNSSFETVDVGLLGAEEFRLVVSVLIGDMEVSRNVSARA